MITISDLTRSRQSQPNQLKYIVMLLSKLLMTTLGDFLYSDHIALFLLKIIEARNRRLLLRLLGHHQVVGDDDVVCPPPASLVMEDTAGITVYIMQLSHLSFHLQLPLSFSSSPYTLIPHRYTMSTFFSSPSCQSGRQRGLESLLTHLTQTHQPPVIP